jgi:hypothetical protein
LPIVPVLPAVPVFGFILMSSGVVLVVPLFWLPTVPVLPVVPVFGFILMSSGVVLVVPLFWLPIDRVWPVVPLELWPDVPDDPIPLDVPVEPVLPVAPTPFPILPEAPPIV